MTTKSECTENSRWHILIATWLGLVFDGLDATIFVLVLFPALSELLHTSSHATVGAYGGIVIAIFMVGWSIGALAFGILADRIGRTKAMMLTILLYAICTGLCATSHTWQELAFYRFLVGCGIGGEQTAGVVLASESWRGKMRLFVTGIIATAFGCGYLSAGLLNMALSPFGWRWLFLVGIIPALLTVYIRAKLKDPAHFQLAQEYKKRLKSDSNKKSKESHLLSQLFSPENCKKTIVVSTLSSVAIVGYWAVMSWIPPWINQLTGTAAVNERTAIAVVMNLGTITAALTSVVLVTLVGRRNAYRIAFTGALVCFISMFQVFKSFSYALVASTFVVGLFVQMPFTLMYIYAPELFPAHIRGTAIGFTLQIGRLMGALCAVLGGQLVALFGGSYAMAASCVASFYVIGIIASFFMPITNGEVEEHSQPWLSSESSAQPQEVAI